MTVSSLLPASRRMGIYLDIQSSVHTISHRLVLGNTILG